MNCSSPSLANPDIDSIAIRISIYAQALLALGPFIVCLLLRLEWESPNAMPEIVASALRRNAIAVLITGSVPLVAGIIQGARGLLAVYDAILVLHLSWITSSIAMSPVTGLMPTVQSDLDPHRSRTKSLGALYAVALHLSATGIFGCWLVYAIPLGYPGCAEQYYVVPFGQTRLASDREVGGLVLLWSLMAVIPFWNLLFFFVLSQSLHIPFTILGAVFKVPAGGLNWLPPALWMMPLTIVLIVAAEQFISYNSNTIVAGFGHPTWGFGEIVAILSIGPPIWTLISPVQDWWKPIAADEEEGERAPLLAGA